MPETPEAPALLSPERLAAIAARLIGPRSASGINEALDASALLADREAFRQAVAAELRELLTECEPDPIDPRYSAESKAFREGSNSDRRIQAKLILAAAGRLHLDLTTPA